MLVNPDLFVRLSYELGITLPVKKWAEFERMVNKIETISDLVQCVREYGGFKSEEGKATSCL
jgi:hypothetical protein